MVIENFKPGVASRLGIDYTTLSARHPELVYASISGFGQTGPFAGRPAFDLVVQAMSGLMDITGEPDGPPIKVGEAFGDLVAGLYASWGILAALFHREQSGQGTYVDVAMFDTLFSMLPTPVAQWMFTGATLSRVGNRHPLSAPFGAYRAQDGYVIIAVLNERQFSALAEVIGRPELTEDPRFGSDEQRNQHEPLVREILEAWLAEKTVTQAVTALETAQIPTSAIESMQDAIESDQVSHRGLVVRQQHPALGETWGMEQPVHFDGWARQQQTAAPALGADGSAVLSSVLELSEGQIRDLIDAGVVHGTTD